MKKILSFIVTILLLPQISNADNKKLKSITLGSASNFSTQTPDKINTSYIYDDKTQSTFPAAALYKASESGFEYVVNATDEAYDLEFNLEGSNNDVNSCVSAQTMVKVITLSGDSNLEKFVIYKPGTSCGTNDKNSKIGTIDLRSSKDTGSSKNLKTKDSLTFVIEKTSSTNPKITVYKSQDTSKVYASKQL